jgi:hypothetical protein
MRVPPEHDEAMVHPEPIPSVAPAGGLGKGDVEPSGAKRFPFNRATMPVGIARLSVDTRGYPVPWFVDKAAPYINGNPDFRIMDGAHLKLAIREKRCWVCGMKLGAGAFAFLAGPMCGVNRTTAEPPSHIECAQWSAVACPFMSHPKRVRDVRDLPPGQMAGVGILRNPGVAMVWVCDAYETWRPPNGGVLFELGEPSRVEWVREGREATRGEIMESVETGLPPPTKSS